MGLRAWAGFIALSIVTMLFYVGILPVWDTIKTMCLSYGVSPHLLLILDKSLYWAPLIILVAAFIHAVTSPAFRRYTTWRGN
jgi:divalent metal cation (Fe/Co/Zn/Cd) transporter